MRTKSLADSGFPAYDITETGVVIHRKTGKHLLPYSSGQVTIKTAIGEFRSVSVMRLVAEAFVDNPLRLPHVAPIDGNRWNVHADNLSWVSKRFRKSDSSATPYNAFGAAVEKRPQIIDMHLKGAPIREIAIKLSLSVQAVTKLVYDFDVDCLVVMEGNKDSNG